jgi:hypothetical protein
MEQLSINLNPQEFTRLANNFYVERGLDHQVGRIPIDAELMNYILTNHQKMQQKYKVALCCICVNPTYWQFIKPLFEGAKDYFLPSHHTDFFLWSDIPDKLDLPQVEKQIFEAFTLNPRAISVEEIKAQAKFATEQALESVNYAKNLTVFPIESEVWPMPTLMRYHMMLQQEEKLKEYDYVFYCDIDMLFVNIVGDEILGDGITAVQQPMYALRKEFWPPYEPNPKSASYIPRPGMLLPHDGNRFMPLYFAGGFQGGRTKEWLVACKEMRKMIDADFNNNYTPIWNDETVFNAYLFKQPPVRVLTPSYTYPDSLIKEYFIPMWGRDYLPKLVTLTKKFSIHAAGGEHVQKTTQQLANLK